MIDVSDKPSSRRIATARAVLHTSPATVARVRERTVPKGDPLEVARAAVALAVKNTPQLIPYCHPVRIDGVETRFELGSDTLTATVTVKAIDRTGVEVEAMTGAATAALVLYDMLKMIDTALVIGEIRLLSKQGGKSDRADVDPAQMPAAVLVVSDSVAAGRKPDTSGELIAQRLAQTGLPVVANAIVPDEVDAIATTVASWIDEDGVRLVITTGGTGLGPRDRTPEAMERVIEREVPGIVEAARAHGQQRTGRSMLSRGRAGSRGQALVVNLPGSPGGVAEALDALLPHLLHALAMLRGAGHADDPRPDRTS